METGVLEPVSIGEFSTQTISLRLLREKESNE